MDLERRKLELEYAKQQKELAKSATICSNVKGTVEELKNMEDVYKRQRQDNDMHNTNSGRNKCSGSNNL